MLLRRVTPLLLTTALTVLIPAAAHAQATAQDGVVARGDVGGVAVLTAPAAGRRWLAGAPRSVGRAARGSAQSVLAGTVVVLSYAVLTSSEAKARSVGAALGRAPSTRLTAAQRALAGRRAGALKDARRRSFSQGRVAGLIVVGGPSSAQVLDAALAAVRARLRSAAARTPLQTLQLAVAARGGHPTPAQAAQAFALTVAPLPGVHPGRDRAVAGAIDPATTAIRWMQATLARQPPARRRVFGAVLAAHGPDATGARRAHASFTKTWKADAAFIALAEQAAADLAAQLGFPLQSTLFAGRDVQPTTPGHEKDLAATYSEDKDGGSTGPPAKCVIAVYPEGIAATGDPVYRREVMTHEVFHCFQAQMAGLKPNGGVAAWVAEGSANWAACNTVAGALPDGSLGTWLQSPGTGLDTRDYDALGFFSLLSDEGVDLWSRWPAVLKTTTGTFATLQATGEPMARGAWARSYAADATRGFAWLYGAPPCTPAVQPIVARTPLSVDDDSGAPLQTPAPYAAAIFSLHSTADVVHIHADRARVDLSSNEPALQAEDVRDTHFCTDPQSSCVCPPGSPKYATEPPPKIAGLDGTILAVLEDRAGNSAGAQLDGMSLEEYCGYKRKYRIVPARSVGAVYLGQTRHSVLKAVSGLRSGEGGSVQTANVLFRRGPFTFPFEYELTFGLCNPAVLEDAAVAACRKQLPRADPNHVGFVQTGSTEFGTDNGLGPGSAASSVIGAYGSGGCVHDIPDDPESAWHRCDIPGEKGRVTLWGFTGPKDAEVVLAVGVYDPAITPVGGDANATR